MYFLTEEYHGDEMPLGHHRAFYLWGWMQSHRLGSDRALGQLATSVTAAAPRNMLTQCLSTSVTFAEQVAWDH